MKCIFDRSVTLWSEKRRANNVSNGFDRFYLYSLFLLISEDNICLVEEKSRPLNIFEVSFCYPNSRRHQSIVRTKRHVDNFFLLSCIDVALENIRRISVLVRRLNTSISIKMNQPSIRRFNNLCICLVEILKA